MKIESKDTDTEQPSAARSFVFPSKKKRVSAEKDPLFFGRRALRARLLLLKKVHFSKTPNCFTKNRLSFFKGCPFFEKNPENALLGNGDFRG